MRRVMMAIPLVLAVSLVALASASSGVLTGRELDNRVGAECCGGYDSTASCSAVINLSSGTYGNCLAGSNATCTTTLTKKCQNSAGGYMLHDSGCP